MSDKDVFPSNSATHEKFNRTHLKARLLNPPLDVKPMVERMRLDDRHGARHSRCAGARSRARDRLLILIKPLISVLVLVRGRFRH